MSRVNSASKRTLTIVIPSYNEAKTIKLVLDKILNLDLSDIDLKLEILVVDDGSKDNTREVLLTIDQSSIRVIHHPRNMGKGRAIRTGIEAASGEYLIIQDADLEQDPSDVKRLVKPILDGSTNVVYGSRFVGSRVHVNRASYWGNMFFNSLVYVLFQKRMSDMWTGYKIARMDVWNRILLKSDGFEIEPEITARFLMMGEKIIEVPISFNPRSVEEGKHIRYRHALRAAWVLVACRFHLY